MSKNIDDHQVHFEIKDLDLSEIQGLLTGGVAPRPIALVSTISENGASNLAPFSFFNAFGSNPPMVAFSPARRGRDGTLKDTYRNLMATKECVIQAVTHSMVEQVNTSSGEYGPDVDEFLKSGLTPIDSHIVQSKRVKESPFQMECRLKDMIHLGEEKGSGNLALCEVIKFHVSKEVMTDGKIDPRKMDHVARNGGAFYTRALGDALFELPMPRGNLGVGFEAIPPFIRNSEIFTANNLGKLANSSSIPTKEEVRDFLQDFENENLSEKAKVILRGALKNPSHAQHELEKLAQETIAAGNTDLAWKIAIASKNLR